MKVPVTAATISLAFAFASAAQAVTVPTDPTASRIADAHSSMRSSHAVTTLPADGEPRPLAAKEDSCAGLEGDAREICQAEVGGRGRTPGVEPAAGKRDTPREASQGQPSQKKSPASPPSR
jgi:hypothetical protein